MKKIKIFKDKQLKEDVTEELNLGIVEAGESKEFTFYAKNDYKADLINLNFSIEHKEVKILEAPKTLQADEVGELKIKWTPSVTLEEGLKTKINIKGAALWK